MATSQASVPGLTGWAAIRWSLGGARDWSCFPRIEGVVAPSPQLTEGKQGFRKHIGAYGQQDPLSRPIPLSATVAVPYGKILAILGRTGL